MKSLLVGLGIGIGLGILFAPRSGQESRSRLRETASDLADSTREPVEEGRDRLQKGIRAVQNTRDTNTGEGLETDKIRPTGTESSST